ncbi:MAG TPA: glutaredoxin 3 [Paraburkholderia sp.]|jgi:glutaredoxin 3
MSAITIYTKPTCPYCIAAKALLRGKGVEFNEINIEGDRATAVAMMERTGRRTVPQIYIGTTHVGGFDDLHALEEQGQLEPLLGVNA